MLNHEQKLDTNIWDKPTQVPIRRGFGEGLLAAAQKDENIVGLCADLTESTQMIFFKEKFPQRFVEVGVAEQNLATLASGMAAMGKIPFITSYAMFSPGRNWEQIRTTIAYNDRPVKIAGSHAGVSVGPDGGTHQAIEDIALMRVIPNMVVLSPCDAIEAKKATIAAASNGVPTYIRLVREKTPVLTTEESPFEIGKAAVFFDSPDGRPDAVIIATGGLVYQALLAAKHLRDEAKIGVTVINLATIKPLDEKTIIFYAKKAGAVVTLEEHQIAGGMGSAVAECLATHAPTPIEFLGVRDVFGQSGTPSELVQHYGMDEKAVFEAVKRVIARKGKK